MFITEKLRNTEKSNTKIKHNFAIQISVHL